MKMSPTLWHEIRAFFKPEDTTDHWGNPYKMKYEVVYGLYYLRKRINKPIYVHCGYEKRSDKPTSTHNFGMAVDCHAEGIHLMDFFLEASRFSNFRGIGIYPHWNNPGLHLDCRDYADRMKPEARWGCDKAGNYVALNWEFIKSIK